MSVRRFVLALGVLGVGPVAAMAADLPLKAPPIAPPVLYSWNGFYAGVNAGGIVGMNSDTQDAAFASTAFGANDLLNTSDKHAPAGALFGGQIGYNLQLSPRWLVGLEADWQWSSLKGSSTACTPAANVTLFGAGANGFGYCLTDEHKLTNIGTARVRGGMIVGDTLWYATGGAAWGTVKDNVGFVGSANPVIFPVALQPGPFLPTAASFSQTRLGWTVGVGAETKLSSNWSVKLEYLYVDLGSVTEAFPIAINPAFGPAFTTGGAAVATRTSHVTDNIVRVGLNYHLNPLALGTGQALAAMPAAVGANWTGFYAGVNAGGIVGMNSDTQDAAFASTAFGANDLLNTSDKHAPAGALFGGQIGYNLQLSPRWLVGLEADWQWSSLKGSSTACTPAASTVGFFGSGANGFGYCLTDEHKLTNLGTARVRGGMIVGDTLWYATGGAAWGTVKDNVGFVGSANPVIFPVALQPGPFLPTAASFSQTRLGWTVGVGAETKLSSNWSVKLEYLYVDLGSVTEAFPIAINPAFGPAFTTGGAAVATRTSHLTDNIVRIGLNYKLF